MVVCDINYSHYPSSNESNIWSNSTLNTGTLNGTYINGLGTTWSDMIETHTWKVGGGSFNLPNELPKTAYNYEIGSNSSSTIYSAKIGLMYVSDYGYAASPANWTTTLNNYDNNTNRNNNWMLLGSDEWTISRTSHNTSGAFYVRYTGYVHGYGVKDYILGVRPSFYLKSNVALTSGDGSQNSPFRIELG